MSALFRKLKKIVAILVTIYIICAIYHTLLNIQLKKKRIAFLQTLSQEPLCRAHVDVIKRLRRLAKDLILVRMTVHQDTSMAKQIERHYNNLQKLLREIEFITSSAVDKEHRQRVEEDELQTFDVCPEVFKGSTFGYPFYKKGFETIRCQQRVPTNDLVTFVFDEIAFPQADSNTDFSAADSNSLSPSLLNFIEGVRKIYSGVTIYIVLESGQNMTRETKQVISTMESTEVRTSIKKKKTEIMQDILNQIKTKYILIGERVTLFSNDSNVERLVRVLSSHDGTHFAGGSIKNNSGHWFKGCLQTQLKNYTLSFKTGYFHSFSECLVCDHLTGPFVAKTASLKKLGFASNSGRNLRHGLYQDLFLRAKQYFAGNRGNAIVSCPDVMFNVCTKETHNFELVDFAKKHKIRKIVEANGKVRWFGCRRGLSYRAGKRCPVQNGYAVPPCCLENLADAVKFIMRQCEEYGILCELQEGTLLGAVKLNKVLPWERDADITFLTTHYYKLQRIKAQFDRQGYFFRELGK